MLRRHDHRSARQRSSIVGIVEVYTPQQLKSETVSGKLSPVAVHEESPEGDTKGKPSVFWGGLLSQVSEAMRGYSPLLSAMSQLKCVPEIMSVIVIFL